MLRLISIIETIINDIYHHIKDNKGCNISAKIPIEEALDKLVETSLPQQ